MSQHMDALAKANRVRLAMADVKHEVAAGTLTVPDALFDPRAASLPVLDLLVAQYKWGPAKARKVIEGVCSERRRVGELTNRQRRLIDVRLERALPSDRGLAA